MGWKKHEWYLKPFPCAYKFYDENENLLYVGSSKHFRRRLIVHRCNSHWYNEIYKIFFFEFDHIFKARAFEYECIRQEDPKYNVIGTRWNNEHLRVVNLARLELVP